MSLKHTQALCSPPLICRGLGNMPGVLSQPVAMEADRSGEDEDAAQPTYMPIVPAGMSTSAPAPQVTTYLVSLGGVQALDDGHSLCLHLFCMVKQLPLCGVRR